MSASISGRIEVRIWQLSLLHTLHHFVLFDDLTLALGRISIMFTIPKIMVTISSIALVQARLKQSNLQNEKLKLFCLWDQLLI